MSAHGSTPSRAAMAATLWSAVGSYSSSSPSGYRLANSASGMRSRVVELRFAPGASARGAGGRRGRGGGRGGAGARAARARGGGGGCLGPGGGRGGVPSYVGEYLNG